MSKEIIKEAIFLDKLLLSQSYEVGRFVGRLFYHPLFGFGNIQTDMTVPVGMSGETCPTVEISWDKEGAFRGATSSLYYEEDTLEALNQRVLDEEKIEVEVKEDAFYMIEDGPFAEYDRAVQDISITPLNSDADI
jgi:hypothetical protein